MQHERHAALADIRAGAFYFLVAQHNLDQHLHRLAEVAAPLALHETQRRVKAARRIQSADGLLQNEVHAHAEGLLRGRFLAVQNRKRYGVLVARRGSQALQNLEAALQVVAVYNYSIELF